MIIFQLIDMVFKMKYDFELILPNRPSPITVNGDGSVAIQDIYEESAVHLELEELEELVKQARTHNRAYVKSLRRVNKC